MTTIPINIIQQNNILLQAKLQSQILLFQLTISQNHQHPQIYTAKIQNFKSHPQLNQNFQTLISLFQWIQIPQNIHFDPVNKIVKLGYEHGPKKSFYEFISIKLLKKELENENDEQNLLREIIEKCNSKLELSNEDIKRNFEIITNKIISINKKQKTNNQPQQFDNIKQHSSHKVNYNNDQISNENLQNPIQYLNQINSLKKQIQTIKTNNVIISTNFIKLQNQIQQNNKIFKTQLTNQTKQLKIQTNKLWNQNMEFWNTYVSQQNQKQQKKIKQQQIKLFYSSQKNFNSFKFHSNCLTKITNDGNRQFAFFKDISYENQSTFKIKLVKQYRHGPLIGVFDYQKQKQQTSSFTKENTICYWTKNGIKYPGGIKQGDGMNVGDVVEVKVDRIKNTIRWLLNNQQKASFVHAMLGEKDRKFMPFVELFDQGDTIEWIL